MKRSETPDGPVFIHGLDQLRSVFRPFMDEQCLIVLSGISDDDASTDSSSFWLRFSSQLGEVEGKLHLPAEGSTRLIIFEPGFPGDGSTRFEKLYTKTLLTRGYAILALRHNGTIVNGPDAARYLNCAERQALAKSKGQRVLGTKDAFSLSDWLSEPLVSLQATLPAFSEVVLIGHSFGVLACLWSAAELMRFPSDQVERIKRIVSLSGATGRLRQAEDPILTLWRQHLDTDWVRQRIVLGKVEENIEVLRAAYTRIHDRRTHLPSSIDLIYVSPWGDCPNNLDELVLPLEAIDIIASLGRGSLVIDKTQFSDETSGRMVHDMDNLRTDVLVRLVEGALWGDGRIATLG
jgi:pimeloyl-ACP methyl ester carboxylesterase